MRALTYLLHGAGVAGVGGLPQRCNNCPGRQRGPGSCNTPARSSKERFARVSKQGKRFA